LTLDCHDAELVAAFWKVALDYVDEPAPPPFATREEWLRHHGVPENEWREGAWLHDPTGAGPRLSILKVPEGKVAKNRLHLDLRVTQGGDPNREPWDQIQDTVERLIALGASVIHRNPPRHVVMADPEGNEFCVA
jgi:hypothetical protein